MKQSTAASQLITLLEYHEGGWACESSVQEDRNVSLADRAQQKGCMILATVNLFFPVVLAVHNAEEYARYEEFVRAYRDRFAERFITRQVFRNAAILFTTAAAVLSVATYVHSTGGWIRLSAIATLAMTFNGITHCVQSLRKRSLTPGTLSAIVLVLPYSAIVIALMRRTVGTSLMSLLGLTAIGVTLTPVVIGFCVLSGYGVSLLWRKA